MLLAPLAAFKMSGRILPFWSHLLPSQKQSCALRGGPPPPNLRARITAQLKYFTIQLKFRLTISVNAGIQNLVWLIFLITALIVLFSKGRNQNKTPTLTPTEEVGGGPKDLPQRILSTLTQ
ncbi:UNVERIFIED_CONTAM: hypothetical protein K2H54_030331 [Gekko kuhli]